MYKASDGSTLSNIFEEEFSKTFDITSCDYPDFAEVNVFTAYSNSRLVNQRRIDVHTALNAQINVLQKMYPLSFLMRKCFHKKQRKECFKH